MWLPEVGGQQPEHVWMNKYHAYIYVCASRWSYKMNYISLYSMHNIKVLSRYVIFQTSQQLMDNIFRAISTVKYKDSHPVFKPFPSLPLLSLF